MGKVGIVGINLNILKNIDGSRVYESSGLNLGNMLFTNAVYKNIADSEFIGFNFDPDEIKKTYSSIIIPAANWINIKNDWGELALRIKKSSLPCAIIGLGTQLGSLKEIKNIPKGSILFLKVIEEQSKSIGVRGDFTAEVLKACGINNIEVLGCPSILTYRDEVKLKDIQIEHEIKLAMGSTRYLLPVINDNNRYDKQRQIAQFAIREANSIYFQSEKYEISKIAGEEVSIEDDLLAKKYYGFTSLENFKYNLLNKGRYFTEVDKWIEDVKENDLYIGTRVHGAIAASLAGVPAILITHDNRTKELAESMAIPNISIEEFEIAMLYDIEYILKNLDFKKFERRSHSNRLKIMEFYKKNNFKCNIGS